MAQTTTTGLTTFGEMGEENVKTSGSKLPLVVLPSSTVRLRDIEAGETYSRTLHIKNVDSRPRTAKVSNPSTSSWRLEPMRPTLQLAPGLHAELQLTFTAASERNHFDQLILQLDDCQFEIRLEALMKAPVVELEGDLTFGELPAECETYKPLVLRNYGPVQAEFSARFESSSAFTVQPTSGTLPAASEANDGIAELEVHCSTSEEGFFASVLEVFINDSLPAHRVEASTRIVQQTFRLLHPQHDEDLNEVNFGCTYANDTTLHSARLYNSGPLPVEFNARCREQPGAEKMGGVVADDAAEWEDEYATETSGPLTIETSSGQLEAYTSKRIIFRFHHTMQLQHKGFMSHASQGKSPESFTFLAIISFSKFHSKLLVPILSQVAEPVLHLSEHALDFGCCRTNEHLDRRVSIRNPCNESEIAFQINRTAYFTPSPPSGRIPPGLSKPVIITYKPKALGKHENTLSISGYCNNADVVLCSTWISCYGESHGKYQRGAVHGGTRALPEDFTEQKNYIDDASALRSRKKMQNHAKTSRSTQSELYARFNSVKYDRRYTFTWDQFVMKQQHRERYDNMLRSAYKERRNRGAKQIPDDHLSLGLKPASGLKEPSLKVPEGNEPLHTEQPSANVIRPHNRPTYLDEESIKRALRSYRTIPGDDREEAQLIQPLTAGQITALKIGPSLLDFGRVSCMHSFTKHLVVQNVLNQAIYIDVHTAQHSELQESYPLSQVVSAGGVSVFAIVINSAVVKSVKTLVSYTINGQHSFQFQVEAEVQPVMLTLSRDDLFFSFHPDNFDSHVTETLLIHNPNNHGVEFQWEGGNEAFAIEPDSGTVPRRNSLLTRITWNPSEITEQNVCRFSLQVAGGTNSKVVSCFGERQEGRLVMKEKSLDFKHVQAGVTAKHTISIRNAGSTATVYAVEHKDESLTITPDMCRISSGATQEVEIGLTCEQVGRFNSQIRLSVRGGKELRLPVNADVVVPDVSMEPAHLDFGSVHLGGATKRELVLHNKSPVFAHMSCNLTDHAAFRLELPRENWSSEDYEQEAPIQEAKVSETVNPLQRTFSFSRSSASLTFGAVYKIRLAPQRSLHFLAEFKPDYVGAKSFKLPLSFEGTGTLDGERLTTIQGKALQPRLLLSESTISFGERVIQSGQKHFTGYEVTLKMTNNTESFVRWSFNQPHFTSGEGADLPNIFTLRPSQGSLKQGEAEHVNIYFAPSKAVQYSASVKIFLSEDEGDVEEYVSLELAGQGAHPRVSFSVREAVLPPVPLGVESSVSFTILNQGFDNLELQAKLPADNVKAPIQVEFPEGKIIGIAKQELPVQVRFSSKRPTSFTTNIAFVDDEGTRFNLLVTACADNSLLSLVPFLQANPERFRVERTGQDVTPSVATGNWALPANDFDQKASCNGLTTWLNSAAALNPLSGIPTDFLSSRGRVFIELIEHLTGKKVQEKVEKFSSNKATAATQLMQQYEGILQRLKSNGAQVNAIKPEMLMDKTSFTYILNARENELSSKTMNTPQEHIDLLAQRDQIEHWNQMLDYFEHVSNAAWRDVTLQVIRVFVLSRITPQQFRSLPGIRGTASEEVPDSLLNGSNIYSAAEAVILAWLNHHFRAAFPEHCYDVKDFSRDLSDGVAFFAALVMHWPELWHEYSDRMTLDVEAYHQARKNFEAVLEMMHRIGMEFNATAEWFFGASNHEMMLFALFLYEHLPELIPQTTLQYTQPLLQSSTRRIELRNPSSRRIVYKARLAGSADFKLEASSVSLEPHSNGSIGVLCIPTSSKEQNARILLTSKREASARASSLVFALQANADTDEPMQIHNFTTSMYELQARAITVSNPFPSDCELSVYTQHDPLDAGFEAEVESEGNDRVSSSRGGARSKQELARKRAALSRKRAAQRRADMQAKHPLPFGSERRAVRIKKNDKITLNVLFLPFVFGAHTCSLVFEHCDYGIFKHHLQGEATLPQVATQQSFSVGADKPSARQFHVPFVNAQLESARKTFLEKHPGAREKQQAELARRSAVVTKETYEVSHLSMYTQMCQTIELAEGGDKVKEKRTFDPQALEQSRTDVRNVEALQQHNVEPNHIVIGLSPNGEGVYYDRVVLQGARDIRLFDLELSASRAGQEATLTLRCQARQQVKQSIPLVNYSDSSLTIRATLTGGDGCFSCKGEATVPAKSTKEHQLTFAPDWIGTYRAELKLYILQTDESNTYDLVGSADEPPEESTCEMSIRARERTEYSINVPNVFGNAKEAEYVVTSDIASLHGNSTLRVPRGSTARYTVSAFPCVPGQYNGTLTFWTEQERYVWYIIELTASMPEYETVVDMQVEAGEAICATLPLENPSEEDVQLEVSLEPSEDVLGEGVIDVPRNSKQEYSFWYVPIAPTKGIVEGSVTLRGARSGLWWFKLRLQAEERKTKTLYLSSSRSTASEAGTLQVENPLAHAIELIAQPSKHNVLVIEPWETLCDAYGIANFTVRYEGVNSPDHRAESDAEQVVSFSIIGKDNERTLQLEQVNVYLEG